MLDLSLPSGQEAASPAETALLVTQQLIHWGLGQDSHLAVPTSSTRGCDELCSNQFALKDPL